MQFNFFILKKNIFCYFVSFLHLHCCWLSQKSKQVYFWQRAFATSRKKWSKIIFISKQSDFTYGNKVPHKFLRQFWLFWLFTMISHFWNLCRACPALDVDKVISLCHIVYKPSVVKILNLFIILLYSIVSLLSSINPQIW